MSKLYLALLWHQHQPLYRDLGARSPAGSYRLPWVRLHALRDYYSMAALAAAQPGLELTINLTPVLSWQLEDYAERGATDRSLELTLKPAERLTEEEKAELLATFFRADSTHQIDIHPRYRELLQLRTAGSAWATEGFSQADIEAIVAEEHKILAAVLPLHRDLARQGRIEVSTTPFYHPILPILIDSDVATLDGGQARPRRFAHPEDAQAQVERAARHHQRVFGSRPRGMWPAEGAVSQAAAAIFAECGIEWIATDRGVLSQSGRFGYRADDPDVLCRPYRAEDGTRPLAVFFRERELSNKVGFDYHRYAEPKRAAADFIEQVHRNVLARLEPGEDHVLTVALDGENSWGAYPNDGHDFLAALYARLAADPDIETTTFSNYLDGDQSRARAPHPLAEQPRVYELFTGSWIDLAGSAPGVDLGTWLGHAEENRAWDLVSDARDALTLAGLTPTSAPVAFDALFAAEGSDWFWWFGEDQGSEWDPELDELFRTHLRRAYEAAGLPAPLGLDTPIADRLRASQGTKAPAARSVHSAPA